MKARLERLGPVALAFVPYAALCLAHAGAVPMWDARVYADCIEKASSFPAEFNCAGHPTAAWAALVASLRWMAPHAAWPLVLVSVALGIAGLWAFRDLTRLLGAGEWDSALLTACLGLFPVVVSGTVDVNPDHGVWVFFLLALRSLLRGGLVEAALFGALLVFTKEPGVLLYALAAGLWALILVARREGQVRDKLRRLLGAWPLVLPLVGFALYVLRGAAAGEDPLWHVANDHPLLDTFTTFRLFSPAFVAQLLGIFVLQFAWLLTLLALARWLRMAARAAFAVGPPEPPLRVYFDALLLLAALALTRYQTFLNLRYYVALFPLLLLAGWAGLEVLKAPRAPALAVLALLFFASSLRTLDPVSKAAMGTIAFGDHPMLDMTSRTGECCGHGRDQIAYNLEHLHLAPLMDQALADVGANPGGRAIGAAASADHYTLGAVDLRTWRRILGDDSLRLLDVRNVEHGARPKAITYLRFFFIDNAADEARLSRFYAPASEKTYDIDGYRLTAVDYRLKALAPASADR